MAFGIQIRTSTGMQDVADIATGARLIEVVKCRSVAGSTTVPDWNSPDGDFYVVNNSTRSFMPYVEWNNSTKVLRWGKYTSTNDAAWSNNFDVYCWE